MEALGNPSSHGFPDAFRCFSRTVTLARASPTERAEPGVSPAGRYRRDVARHATILSHRLDDDEGVGAQSAHWATALGDLGFAVRRVAGEFSTTNALSDVLVGSDLVIVDNLCSVPRYATPARAVAAALTDFAAHGGRVVLRHHDLPWQPGGAQQANGDDPNEFPLAVQGALHATINLRSRRELRARGFAPVLTVHNHFDLDAPSGDRATTRAALGFGDDEIVFFQPSRASERTNVAGAIRYLQTLHTMIPAKPLRYWLRGPIDDDVAPIVHRLLERCPVPVTIGPAATAADAYAACDVVMLPSTWERFGDAAIESVVARRPCVVGTFPVLGEIEACGLRFFALDEPAELVKYLARPSERFLDVNLRRARLSFSITDLPWRIDEALTFVGLNR